jgi:exopolysaccharide biosynthesis polyprenyl glycosylphosphotransferase
LIGDRSVLARRRQRARDGRVRHRSFVGASRRGLWTASPPAHRLGAFVAFDALSIVAALVVAHVSTRARPLLDAEFVRLLLIAPLIWVCTLAVFGLYEPIPLRRKEARDLLASGALGMIAIILIEPAPAVSRAFLVGALVCALSLELGGRSLLRTSFMKGRADEAMSVRTLLVGGLDEVARIASALRRSVPWLVPVGGVTDEPEWSPALAEVPLVGQVRDLEAAIREHRIGCVFVASTAVSPADVQRISHVCRRSNVELRISVSAPDMLPSRLSLESVDGITTLHVGSVRLTGPRAVLKRALDLVFASIGLLAAAPLMGIVALLIRSTSPGPALFRQTRVTKEGRPFEMLKFRTMVVDAEPSQPDDVIDLTKPFFKLEDDPRLTRVGSVLRSFSIDEVPQLWNVLKGEMSLVGPRPLPIEQVEANPFLAPRHEVRGGMTGLWQISGRSELDSTEALRIDRMYIENWSLGLDVVILWKTVGAVIRRKGAM